MARRYWRRAIMEIIKQRPCRKASSQKAEMRIADRGRQDKRKAEAGRQRLEHARVRHSGEARAGLERFRAAAERACLAEMGVTEDYRGQEARF